MTTSFILGLILIISSIFTLVIVLSTRKIDFQTERLLSSDLNIGERIKSRITQRRTKSKIKLSSKTKSKKRTSIPSPPAFQQELEDSHSLVSKPGEELLDEKPLEDLMEKEKSEEREEEIKLEERSEEEGIYSRDILIKIPQNMCINEVFRLVIQLTKEGEASEELDIRYTKVSEEEAKYYSLSAEKLGEKLTEASIKLQGLKEGPLIIRPYFTNGIAYIVPSDRKIFFDPKKEKIIAEFFITPRTWTTKAENKLRIEFEQNYEQLLVVNVPVKIYKKKYEAFFGLNISGLQKYILLVYSAIGSLMGLYGTLSSYLSFLPNLPF